MYLKKTHIHFVGIGGIGMSGIAKILHNQGYLISGCDADMEQQSVQELLQLGCRVYCPNNTPSCHDDSIDIIVYSSAIQARNPEIVAAQQKGIPTIPRALMLAELMRTKHSIAIAGSHGKTTTTSIISHLLIEAHEDPTVIIGGHLKNISTNARLGAGDFLVAEADESDRSLLHLQASIAIVTNIGLEHLDTYRDLEDIKQTFMQFLNNLPFYGKAILCVDDPVVRSLLPIPHLKTITYGFDHGADIQARNVMLYPTHSAFTVVHLKQGMEEVWGNITFAMPGRHNVLNVLAALTLTHELGIPFETSAQALTSFKGVERRFGYHGLRNGTEIFDDYGHHPTEIFNTLLVARKRAQGKLNVVFQPHRYTRTSRLWQEFVDLFAQADIDNLILTDIYAASEAPLPDITSEKLVEAIRAANPHRNVSYVPFDDSFAAITQSLEPLLAPGDLLLLQGAGKLNKLAKQLT